MFKGETLIGDFELHSQLCFVFLNFSCTLQVVIKKYCKHFEEPFPGSLEFLIFDPGCNSKAWQVICLKHHRCSLKHNALHSQGNSTCLMHSWFSLALDPRGVIVFTLSLVLSLCVDTIYHRFGLDVYTIVRTTFLQVALESYLYRSLKLLPSRLLLFHPTWWTRHCWVFLQRGGTWL